MSFWNLIPKRTFSSSIVTNAIQNVTVIGAGLMGAGIAQVRELSGNFEIAKNKAMNNDNDNNNNDNGFTNIAAKSYDIFVICTNLRVNYGITIESLLASLASMATCVTSARITSNQIIKKQIVMQQVFYKQINWVASANTIFVSNTSSLRISNIATATQRTDKFGGLHFFNPVPYMKLLEVVRTTETSDETYETLISFGSALEKQTVTCKDTPGFIVNRFLIPLSLESIRMIERGDASPRDIDTAMKLGAGHIIGPIGLADYVGLDVLNDIYAAMEYEFPGNPVFKTPELIKKLVKEGKFGCKTGEGFYEYNKK
ncbi:unnamed protein product, partial [Meganyctiphanes norvegica]